MTGGGRPIHLVSIIGAADVALLPHLVRHYCGLGIESFFLVLNVSSPDDPGYAAALEVAAACGAEFSHVLFGTWTLRRSQRIFRYVMDRAPADWYVLADADELHVYDRPLPELIKLCELGGYDHVNGCFVDRVAADGDFPAVGEAPLWDVYPLAGPVSATLACALPLKTAIARGHVELLPAQHGTAEGFGLPWATSAVQVHHFKWVAGIVQRLRARVRRYAEDPEHGERWAALEAERFLSRLVDGRIDVTDPRLLLRPCRNDYLDHPQWPAIGAQAAGWQWAIRR